jgi:hypothetical protein
MGDRPGIFIIRCVNGWASVARLENGEAVPLKMEGEETFRYRSDEFWKWFREKTNYDSEELSFAVITDIEEFSIPSDIRIARKSGFRHAPPVLKTESEKVLFFPEISESEQDIKTICKNGVGKGLLDYFIDETERIRLRNSE